MNVTPLSPYAGARVLLVVSSQERESPQGCPHWARAAAVLEQLGLLPVWAHSGTEAREHVESVDLALVRLSGLADPLTLIAHLWCVHPELPVFVVGGPAEREASQAALRMGVAAVLSYPLDEHELRFATRIALEQHRASAQQFTRELARTLTSLSALLNAADIRQLQPALEEIVRLFRADKASLLLFDDPLAPDGRMRMAAAVGFPPGVPETVEVRRGEGVAGRVAQEGIPQLLLRTLSDYPRFSDLRSDDAIVASLSLPVLGSLQGRDRRVLGVLNLARQREGDVFTPRDLEVCEFIAASIGEMLSRLKLAKVEAELSEKMAAVEKLTYAGELAAGIAHEVANPVSCLHANLRVLAEYLEELAPALKTLRAVLAGEEHGLVLDPAPELVAVLDDLPAVVGESLEGSDRALRIVADIKAMVRVGDGSEPAAPVSLSELVEGTLRLLRPRLVGRCRVETALDPEARVLGYEMELSQVLVNLVVNAADACEAAKLGDKARVRVVAARREEGCILSVSDNGIGIPEEVRDRIFTPLFTTKPQGVGTGLGLGIVRRIVERHRGSISLHSTPGCGTTFEVRLPPLEDAPARKLPQSLPSAAPSL